MTIERVKLKSADLGADPRAQLARDAQQVLGYNNLAAVALKSKTLGSALAKLEIDPLDRASVLRYKAKKAKPGMWSDIKLGVKFASGLLITLPLFVFFVFKANEIPATAAAVGILAIIAAVAFGLGSLALIIASVIHLTDSHHYSAHRQTKEWHRLPLSGFTGVVPEFVLSKAVQIKREVPNVSLIVEQLADTTERNAPRPMPDPFLVASLGNETYYIDVWNEAEYEQML